MAERFSDRQSSVAGLIFLVPMVLLVLLDSSNVLNPWTKTAWLAGASLVLGIGLLFLPYTAIDCTDKRSLSYTALGKGRLKPIIIKSARLYPGLVTWISERAPLPYEWIATPDAGGRRVLENNGPYSRVARTAT